MIWYAARQFLRFVLTLLVAALVVFLVLDLLAGDQAKFVLGLGATDEAVAALRVQLGLDQPQWLRFLGWIGGMLKGDFGQSYAQGVPAGGLIAGRLAVTVPLALLAMAISAGAALLAIPAALRPGSVGDRLVSRLGRVLAAVPGFWLGMVLVLVLSEVLHLLPPGGFVPWTVNPLGALGSLILPVLALAVPSAAFLIQAFHRELVQVRRSAVVRALQARGMTLREAMRRHGIRNATIAAWDRSGVALAYLFAGAVIVENVFYLPGMGRLLIDAVGAHDLVLVRSGVMVLTFLVAGTMFLTDLGRGWADPRRRERSAE
jgi:peptide/nickel transport system permease protein